MTLRKKQEKNVEKKRGNHAMHVTKLTELPNGIDMKCQEEISNYFSPIVFFLSQLFCFKFVHFHFQRWTTCKMTWKYEPFHFFPKMCLRCIEIHSKIKQKIENLTSLNDWALSKYCRCLCAQVDNSIYIAVNICNRTTSQRWFITITAIIYT